MHKFSQDLIDDIIQYFQDTHQIIITEDQAELYLSSLADLYQSYVELLAQEKDLPLERGQDRVYEEVLDTAVPSEID